MSHPKHPVGTRSLDQPFLPSISSLASLRRAIVLPWGTRPIELGASFQSNRSTSPDRPFLSQSAFDGAHLAQAHVLYDASPNAGTYEEHTTSMNSHSSEHLRASIGVSIGGSFLGGSVSGEYDKAVLENSNISVRPSAYSGTPLTRRIPPPEPQDIPERKYPAGSPEAGRGASPFGKRLEPPYQGGHCCVRGRLQRLLGCRIYPRGRQRDIYQLLAVRAFRGRVVQYHRDRPVSVHVCEPYLVRHEGVDPPRHPDDHPRLRLPGGQEHQPLNSWRGGYPAAPNVGGRTHGKK